MSLEQPPQTTVSDGAKLLHWYDGARRDLPWRGTRDPYRVWVSEVMLQQTRVATAVPYYQRFLERFPTVHDLAAAGVDEVLALWSGLGYYRRARQMHAAAVAVSEGGVEGVVQEGGTFPRTAAGLAKLPGIGPYTAAAVASICFGEVVPVLDGNVERLLARRLALAGDVKRTATRQRLLAAATTLLDSRRPGDSNQAMMELGATVCTPRGPRCGSCPVAMGCRGRDQPELYPEARAKKPQVGMTVAVAVVRRQDGAVLLVRRRHDDEVMAGLWELPQVETSGDVLPDTGAGAFRRRYGGAWRLGPEACRVKHNITHRSITLRVYPATLVDAGEVAEPTRRPETAWVPWTRDSHLYATSSMVPKVLEALEASDSRED